MEEIWKDVIGYEGLYQVSNLGRVKSLSRKRNNGHFYKETILRFYENRYGYYYVDLYKNKQCKHKTVHRLVAEAFISNVENKPEVNHRSEDKKDNRAFNLEWATRIENNNYGTRNKRAGESLKKHSKIYSEICKKIFSKPVFQYSKEGEFLNVWPSTNEAGRSLKISQSDISACCRGKLKTVGGFVWKYKEQMV